MRRLQRLIPALSVIAAAIAVPGHAHAAGAAYVVDVADVAAPGNCKVESWLSFADNHDFLGAVAPTCVVDLFRPVELNAQFSRFRADGEWGSSVAPKAKTNIIPTGIGTFGLAISSTATIDLITGEIAAVAATMPATLRLSEDMRININGGWQWDRILDRHFLTYGLGFDWRTHDNVFTLTIEVFGQAGSSEFDGVTQPRFQTGVRFRPVDRFSVDFIYGRNLQGENANWFTVATTVRFPAGE